MALDPTKFHTNSGGGRQIHSYDSGADAAATVLASGYFSAITGRLHKGDVIHLCDRRHRAAGCACHVRDRRTRRHHGGCHLT